MHFLKLIFLRPYLFVHWINIDTITRILLNNYLDHLAMSNMDLCVHGCGYILSDLTNKAISMCFSFPAGYLLKKSAKTNGWSKRRFVLNEKSGKVNQFSWIVFELLICYEDVLLCFRFFFNTCWLFYFMVLVWSVGVGVLTAFFSISAWVHKETGGKTFSWCHHSWGVHNLFLYTLCYLLHEAGIWLHNFCITTSTISPCWLNPCRKVYWPCKTWVDLTVKIVRWTALSTF